MNISTQLNNFLRYLTLHGLSQKSLKYYKSDLSHFLAWTEGRNVSNSLIREYINSQRMITPASTLNRRLSTLRSYSNFIGKDIMSGIENVSSLKDITANKFKVSKSSPYKKLQEIIISKFEKRPKLQNMFSKLFFNRPNWYRRYHSYPLATYIHIAILILFTSISGYAVYDQVFYSADRSLAFPTALTRPNRYLSFQGRLTDNLGNPKTVATDMVFKLYSVSSGGTALWDSGTCSITPDQDGIFSTLLGSSCGAEIASSVFSENAAIWLGATMGVDAEATPRVQIATVAYALNAETLQGFPAGTGTSTIPYINSSGSLVLANASPKIQSTSGTFAVERQALTITTPNTSDGIITINPDGVGTLDLTFEGAAPGASANGFVNATNANITSGSLYSGTVASNATGYNFINFLSGSSPTSKFSVDSTGLTTVGADLYVSSGISTFGTAVSNGTIEATKFCTGDGETNCITDFSSLGSGSGDISAVGSMVTGATFADSSADDDWLGLGGAAGRIEFDDQTVDEVNILAANLGVGTNAPDKQVEINSATGANLRLTYNDSDGTAAEYADFSISSSGDLTINPQGNLTVTTDGTGNGEVILPDDSIGPNEIFTTGQTDEYCLTYEATGSTWAWQSCGTGGSSVWSDLTAPTGNLSLAMDANTTTFGWTSTGALDAWTNNFNNNSTSSTTQNALVINNAVVGSFTDTATENLILLQQLDTTAAGTTALTNAFKIDSAGNSGITNGINITNSAGDIATGININDTAGGTIGTGIALSGTFTVGIDAGDSIITNIGNSGTDFTSTGGLNLAGTFDANGQVDLGDGGDVISIYGSDTNIELVDGSTFNIDGDGGPTSDLVQIGNGDTSSTSGVDALNITFAFSDSSGDLIHLSPTYAGGATDTLTLNVFEIDAFSPTNVSGTDTVNGIRLGNLTDPGATITSTAFSVGTGWDTVLGGTTAGTNILSFTNATLTSAGNLSLAGTTGLTFTSTGGVNLTGGTIVDATDEVDINDDLAVSGVLQVGGTTATTYSRFGTATTGHGFSAADDLLVSGDMELDGVLYLDGRIIANSNGTATMILAADPAAIDSPNILDNGVWWVNNNVNNGMAALMVNQAKGGDIFSASQSGTTKFTIQNDGDVVLTNGQLRLGNLASTPTAEGAGSMFFNTTTNTNQCYNGTSWYNCGGTLYSNTNASVADGSYITVTHNLATNDLLSSAWINAQGVWKSLESSYQPAIAWEGKDTERGVYHNEVNLYKPSNETNTYADNTLQNGLLFDTFEDRNKTDSANTTSSVTNQTGDDGSANYMTLNNRVQAGRVGLSGGQIYSTSTTDNSGNTYLASNTINDIYYYDRSKDSSPDVQVELGIDPNWYNGVTLSVATSSATYSQNGTIADKNPNLTINYNGSLIKATGTDSTPRTIYITIKTPTTFDWTNYQGDSSTGVTITPGTAQTLGSTGVSVTFSDVNYNVGDVFKVASWYIEASSSTRGSKQQFPERSNIIVNGDYINIIDADTQKLWMSIQQVSWKGGTSPDAVSALNGNLYIATNTTNSNGNLRRLNFFGDDDTFLSTGGTYRATGANTGIASRNTAGTNGVVVSPVSIITVFANDVATAVIPNQPTQEVTVSGWGYIVGDSTTGIEESINLPYKFNSIPTIQTTFAGYRTSVPSSLDQCNTSAFGSTVSATPYSITNNSVSIQLFIPAGTFLNTNYHCYTWTATGSVSPKQFVAVATGAGSSDGGATIINETDGTKADILVGTQNGDTIWQNKVAIAGNSLYTSSNDSTTDTAFLNSYDNIHGLQTETTWAQYFNGNWGVGTTSGYGTVLGTATGTSQITSLQAVSKTSTQNSSSNTIYVGTATGATVVQEYNDHSNLQDGNSVTQPSSVKYYNTSYITEEMVGDVRGMWPFTESSGSLTDASIKGNYLEDENAPTYSVSGVRGTGLTFDNANDYLCSDSNNDGTCDVDTDYAFGTGSFSISAWFKHGTTLPSGNFDVLVDRNATATPAQGDGFRFYMNTSGNMVFGIDDDATWSSFIPEDIVTSPQTYNDNQWHHVVAVKNGTTDINLYMDGVLVATTTTTATASISDSSTLLLVGAMCASGANCTAGTNFWDGQIDELMITANTINANQIKNMYQVGYRALQSHSTSLGHASADSQQKLNGDNNAAAVVPDWNNQYVYVGMTNAGGGGVNRIQLNSDTNIKTYKASAANIPAGGTLLPSNGVNTFSVGYNLEAVGTVSSGVSSMGFDDNSTATSGNFVSKTMTLPKNIGSAVLWVSPVLDSSDGSNTFTVKASNDGGSNYVTCTLTNTNSSPAVPEKEYACTFSTADNDLKVKFEFVRGSTKTNTYVTQYGISWLGETGFRVEQTDANNVRLYNYSGETQNLKLNVTGASTTNLANPWTDAGSYLYPTGYEALRVYDGAGTNYLGISHDGTLANLTYNGTTVLSINSSGDMLPNTNDAQNLGSDTKRWKDIFLGGDTMHIGTSTTDEATIAYNTTTNVLGIDTDSTTNGDIAFFTNNLYLDKSAGSVGIGTTGPAGKLDVTDTSNTLAALSLTNNTATTLGNGANTVGVLDLQSTSLTTGNFLNIELNALTSGKGLNLSSTSTGLTTGSLSSVTASGDPGATWTGSLGLFEYLTSTDVDVDGSALKVGLMGAGGGEGSALNVTTAQTGTTALALRVNDDGTYTDSSPFVVDKAGNVGIGTSTPAHKLSVMSDIALDDQGFIDREWSGSATFHTMMGSSYFDGTNYITNPNSNLGSNNVVALGAYGDSVRFFTSASTGGGSRTTSTATWDTYERMRIDTSGNVAIGAATVSTSKLYIASVTDGTYGLYVNNSAGNTVALLDNNTMSAGEGGVFIRTNDTSASNEYFLALQSDIDGTPDNEFLFRTDGTANADGSFTGGGADVAEYYYINGLAEEGDLVSIPTTDNNFPAGKTVEKSDGTEYDNKVVGVVSTNPGLVAGGGNTEINNNYENQKPIALAGRVPVKVNLENGEIKKGDLLTSSSVPGVAMKLNKAGHVIGQALEDYDGSVQISEGVQTVESERMSLSPEMVAIPAPQQNVGKIMIFVKNSWSDPEMVLAGVDELIIGGSQDDYNLVNVSNGQTNNKIGAFKEAAIAKLKAGFGSFKQIETSTISPVADTDLIIDLQPDDARSATKFAIKGNDNQEVAVIDADGNAEFDGTVTSSNLEVTNDATIAGTLYAENIESERLNQIENLLAEVESNQTLLSESQNWSVDTAENINVSELVAENIFVTGNATVTSLFVAENLTAKSLDSINGTLSIQSLAIAPIEIMAGRITIDTNGDTKFLGNVEVAGNLKLDGNFVVASDIASEASGSAEIIEGQINTNATAGTAKLDANLTELKIINNKVKTNSLVYVTPVTSTQNKVLYVKSKDTGEFTVGFSEAIDTDVEFNWWIIELGNISEATESGQLPN